MLGTTIQEMLLIISFACKSAEMLEAPLPPPSPANMTQWQELAKQVKPILARIDNENPSLLPLPHDGVAWADR